MADNVFKSPLEKWPGELTFPATFTGGHYKAWAIARDEEPEADNVFREWRGVVAVADFKLKGLNGKHITADGENAPFEVILWAVQCGNEFLRPMLNPKV